jgi:hypothetical protein
MPLADTQRDSGSLYYEKVLAWLDMGAEKGVFHGWRPSRAA